MHIVVVGINARYIHTNLAIRYLYSIISEAHEVFLQEFTINHHAHEILKEVYNTNAEILCFSSYIWNIELILKVVSSLKKVSPDTTIILGGPEVSYDSENIMRNNDAIDFIISGEGEVPFVELLTALENNEDYSKIPHLSYRVRGKVYVNAEEQTDVSKGFIPVAYHKEHVFEAHQIYYYESSRGCPFNCQFCLSGHVQGMTYLPLERVYKDLDLFIEREVKQVKFVDRTFNADGQRALAIWKYIKQNDNGKTNFHFEINAALLTHEMRQFLHTVPEGLFQFEIGVQTTNEHALEAISRFGEKEKDMYVIKELQKMGNIHLHVDLIAGLPHEDYFSFRNSFDDVFRLQTDMIQLGFLKLLKGSGLRSKRELYDFVFQDYPPYEVLSTRNLSYGELLLLKGIEDMLERYWNNGRCRNIIKFIIDKTAMSPFAFFDGLSKHWQRINPSGNKIGYNDQVAYIRSYVGGCLPEHETIIDAVLKFDLAVNKQHKEIEKILDICEEDAQSLLHEVIHRVHFREQYFKDMNHQPAKKLLPYIHLLKMPKGFEINQQQQLIYHEDKLDEQEKYYAFIYPRNSSERGMKTHIIPIKENQGGCR